MTPEPGRSRELFAAPYRLRERVSARARYLRVEIRGADEVLLVYPRRVSRTEAHAFLRDREGWILEQLERQRRQAGRAPPPLRWGGDDRLLLAGELQPLRWARGPQRQAELHVRAGELLLLLPRRTPPEPAALEQGLRRALLARARAEALRLTAEESARLGLAPSDLRINDPVRQWGSCNPGGRICLSWRLLLAPPAVFRYVVVHELCHLRHHDHSPRFWGLVAQQLPDYESSRRWLREHSAELQAWLPRAYS